MARLVLGVLAAEVWPEGRAIVNQKEGRAIVKAHIGKHTAVDRWYCVAEEPNGSRTYRVINESYAVAAAVADAINYPERWESTEAYELADLK